VGHRHAVSWLAAATIAASVLVASVTADARPQAGLKNGVGQLSPSVGDLCARPHLKSRGSSNRPNYFR
jgi:hypothetical protein